MHYTDDPNDNSDCECTLDPLKVDANLSPQLAYDFLNQVQSHTHSMYPRPELLSMDNDQVGSSPPGAASFSPLTQVGVIPSGPAICLNAMAPGTSSGRGLANEITIKKISYRYGINLALTTNFARVCLIWDRQPNGVVPVYTDIFYGVSAAANRASLFAHLNINNRGRFIILKEDDFPLTTSNSLSYYMSGCVPIDMVSTYAPSGSTRVVPTTGALLLIAFTNAASGVTFSGNWRVTYVEN